MVLGGACFNDKLVSKSFTNSAEVASLRSLEAIKNPIRIENFQNVNFIRVTPSTR